MQYGRLLLRLLAVLAPIAVAASAAATPVLKSVDVNPRCVRAGHGSVDVYIAVGLPHPCYGAEFQVSQDPQTGYDIAVTLLTLDTLCAPAPQDTTYLVTLLAPSGNPQVRVSLTGQPGELWTTFAYAERGDLNDNGIAYEVADAVNLIQTTLGGVERNEHQVTCWLALADLNHDGRVNLVDIVWMWQIIIGVRQPDPR